MIFKILEEVKQSVPNTASRNGWIFWYSKSRLRYPSIYLYRFSIYYSLIFSNRLIDKHLSDYYPNHSILHNPATQKQSATLQCADCDENLNLSRVFATSFPGYSDEEYPGTGARFLGRILKMFWARTFLHSPFRPFFALFSPCCVCLSPHK